MELGDAQQGLGGGAQVLVRSRLMMDDHDDVRRIALHSIDERPQRLVEEAACQVHDARCAVDGRRGKPQRGGQVEVTRLLDELEAEAVDGRP